MYRTLGGHSAATCAAHPAFPSVDVCARCHAHTCAHCHAYAALEPLCAACAKGDHTERARMRSRVVRTVGALVATVSLAIIVVAVKWHVDPHGWGAHRHAIEALTTMLHEQPCVPENIRWLTWELDAAHDRASAARYLDEVTAVCRLPADIHKLAFDAHMATNRPDAALRDASRRVLLDGRDRTAYLDRSRAYVALGKLGYAILDAESAYRLGSQDDELLESMARLYRLQGMPDLTKR